MATLQQSHDELARAVAEFLDQKLTGSHEPTVLQWLTLAAALNEAAKHQDPQAFSRGYVAHVADLIVGVCEGPK